MKKLVITLLVILCASCASNRSDGIDSQKSAKAAQQHKIMLALAAFYYCEYKKWPENMSEVERYQKDKNINLGVSPAWDWLSSSEFSYSKEPSYALHSSTNVGRAKPVVISSGQNVPVCNNGKNELVGAHLDIDLGE